MMRQSSSRNQRTKKLKMKPAIQSFVLLAISIWLLYQLKHTFDKKQTVNATANSSDENESNDERGHDKTRLGRKDLPQNMENTRAIDREKENEVDEEDEEKDTELEQLLDDVEVRENGQEEEDRNVEENGEDKDESADGEYGNDGEEEEEENVDGEENEIEENGTVPTVNASISVHSDSDSASNQTVSVDSSSNQENNMMTNVEVKQDTVKTDVQNELPATHAGSVQAGNETTADAPPYLSTKVEETTNETKEG